MEKPLHVRVAEALGCSPWARGPAGRRFYACGCSDGRHSPPAYDDGTPSKQGGDIYGYDTDWSATGPLIEKYRFFIDPTQWGWCAMAPYEARDEDDDDGRRHHGDGPTPLIAVCNLLLALAAAGKLPKEVA